MENTDINIEKEAENDCENDLNDFWTVAAMIVAFLFALLVSAACIGLWLAVTVRFFHLFGG